MIDQKDGLEGFGRWFAANGATIYAVCLSVGIAGLRIAYSQSRGGEKRTRLQTAIECALCGAITLSLSSALELFGLPSTAGTAVGGSVGFLGVEKIRILAERYIDTKLKPTETKTDKAE